ncbi:MAG: DUF1858 domain-containing protein, partial [Patescibacteria group bacterium]
KIGKEMNIAEVVEKYPQTREIFFDLGLGCVGCVASSFETLEEGLLAHGLDVDEVLKKLNSSLK